LDVCLQMRVFIIGISLVLCSCINRDSQEGQVRMDTTDDKDKDPVLRSPSFFDSVLLKWELTHDQVMHHTGIDSIFFTGFHKEAKFSGDTIVSFVAGVKGVIINYDDRRNCLRKFIFIFLPGNSISSDHEEIYSECDRDEGFDYFSLDYKIISDSTFRVFETLIPKHKDTPINLHVIQFMVKEKGKIDSMQLDPSEILKNRIPGQK
jgi:hypothetical protein